ncbi:MAG: T9SS type A sorting domain-containing protein [Saprospiraceae bacterium]|nr:T9SS type A sorting domain-containing protein [Saprospiraceae bacterium]
MTVLDIEETANDLWLASDVGLFKIDKNTLNTTHYNPNNSILPDEHIQTISSDQDGNLWIGTYDLALLKIDGNTNQWSTINYPTLLQGTNLTNNIVYCSGVDSSGTLWLGSLYGLMSYDGTNWDLKAYTAGVTSSYPIWNLTIRNNGDICIGSFNFLTYNAGSDTWLEHSPPNTSNSIIAYSDCRLTSYKDSNIFLFPDNGTIHRITNGAWTSWNSSSGTGSGTVNLPVAPNSLNLITQEIPNGDLIYNSYGNVLVRFDGNNWTVDSTIANLNSNIEKIDNFIIAQNGDYWVFEENTFEKYNGNTLQSGSLISLVDFSSQSHIITDQNKNIHLSGHNKGIQKNNGGNWSTLPGSDQFQIIYSTVFDTLNYAWIISQDSNPKIIQQTGPNTNNWFVHDHSSSGGVLPLFNSGASQYYSNFIASSKGFLLVVDQDEIIYKYINNNWSILSNPGSATNFHYSQMSSDNSGNIWWMEREEFSFGVYQYYLNKFDGTSIQTFNAPNASFSKGYIDANGDFWTSYSSGQINKFDGNAWSALSFPSAANIYNLTGQGNNIYCATSNGLYVYDGQNWSNFNIQNSPISMNSLRHMQLDYDGKLWIKNQLGFSIDIYDTGFINTSQSIVNKNAQHLINIYPNPTNNFLHIETEIINARQIYIHDTYGRIIKEFTYNKNNTYNVAFLPKGIYWLCVTSNDKTYRAPFIKQ